MLRSKRSIALWGVQARAGLVRVLGALGFKEDYYLIVLSIVIGTATGLGAHLFYSLIEFATHYCYGTGAEESYGLFGQRAYMLILLPASGALLVGCITTLFAKEAKGHGVPEVMDAIYRSGGVIRPRVALAKAVSSALTIGSGGSAGTEGPIVQIGAALGSTIGQLLKVTRRQMSVLVACGVAGGIAAIFNAPIAGVLFALEIFLREFSLRTFSPVVFASVISCSLTHTFRPADVGIFETRVIQSHTYVFNGTELLFYLGLGVCCAAVAVTFIRSLYFTEDVVEKIRLPRPLKPVLGAVLLGGIGIVAWLVGGRQSVPAFYGNGYPVITKTLGSELLDFSAVALLGLAGLKIVATCFTLGFGGSGGVFAPSLLMGAATGGAFGLALLKLGWVESSHVSAYALVGMAAVVAGTTHAPLTAIVILYELTREPRIILPVMFAAIVSVIGAQILLRESIYTLRLVRRGIRVGSLADLTILKRMTVDDVPLQPAPIVHLGDPLQKLLDIAAESDVADFVVVDEAGEYQGMVVADDVKTAALQPVAVPLLLVADLLREGLPVVGVHDSLDTVLDKFARCDVPALPVRANVQQNRIEGLITRQAIIVRYQAALDERQ